MGKLSCEGWWIQDYFGRQPMHELILEFASGEIEGTGVDVIGPFILAGRIEQGRVAMRKRYLGRHTVNYVGSYDGEGTLHGTWEAGSFQGPWAILIRRPQAEASDIVELRPDVDPNWDRSA